MGPLQLHYFLRRPHLRAPLYAGVSLKKPNTKLQMVPRTRRVYGRSGYREALNGYGARLVRIFRSLQEVSPVVCET